MLGFGLVINNSSCKTEEQESYPMFPFNFYFVDKLTGENPVGEEETKPFSPYDVSVYVIINGDPDTKKNHSENFGFHKDDEKGYIFGSTYFFDNRRDYIIHLGDLEPDTLTLLMKSGEGAKAYLNSEFIDDVRNGNNIETPFYEIKKDIN